MKEIISFIKDKKEVEENKIFSLANLQIELLSEGIEVNQPKLKEILKQTNFLFQVNSSQFISVSNVEDFLTEEVDQDFSTDQLEDLYRQMKKLIEDNFFIFEVDIELIKKQLQEKGLLENKDSNLELKKEITTELVILFEDYYRENKKAVNFNNSSIGVEVKEKFGLGLDDIFEILKQNNIFYKLTGKTFALSLWILRGISKKILTKEKMIRLREVEMACREILNKKRINKNNLVKLFANSNHFEFFREEKYLKLKTSLDMMEADLKEKYRQDLLAKGIAYIFSPKKDEKEKLFNRDQFFLEPQNIYELKKKLEVDLEQEILFYKLLSLDSIYYESGQLFKDENLRPEIVLYKSQILLAKLKEDNFDYKLKKILKLLFEQNKQGLKVKELKSKISILFVDRYQEKDIIHVLESESDFLEVDYKKWIDRNFFSGDYKVFRGDFKQDLKQILDSFSNREVAILKRRTLIIRNQETLESLGQDFDVSRERIRQIEKKAARRLHHIKYKSNYHRYFRLLERVFKDNRVVNLEEFWEHRLIKEYFRGLDLEFLLGFYNQYNNQLDKKEIRSISNQYLIFLTEEKYDLLWQRAKEELADADGFIDFEKLIDFFAKFKINNKNFISKQIEKDMNKLKIDSSILCKEKKIYSRDRIKLILSLAGESLHYKKITELYNKYFKKTTAHNIHARLDDYEQFVRVDSGTFGLSSWGCQEDIYVRELNCRILKKAGQPLPQEEIIERVKKFKEVSTNTIKAFLYDNDKIFKCSSGIYALKEWKEDHTLAKKYKIGRWRIKASENDTTSNYFLGSCFGYEDRVISVHKVSKSKYKSLNIGLSNKIIKQADLRARLIVIDSSGKIYQINFNLNHKDLYFPAELSANNNLQDGDIIYLEYYKNGVIRVHKWSEYEYNYKPLSKNEIQLEEADDEAVSRVMKFILGSDFERINSLESAIESGLNNGYVQMEDLINLNYQEEEVADHFEAIQVLDEKNIEIIYD